MQATTAEELICTDGHDLLTLSDGRRANKQANYLLHRKPNLINFTSALVE